MSKDDKNTTEKLNALVVRCQSGSEEAFTELIEEFSGGCYGYFYRLTGNAEVSNDLLSELFMKLVEKIGSFKGGSFKGWLYRVASNIFYDYLRHKQRQKRLLEGKTERLEVSYDTVGSEMENKDQLAVAISHLDKDTVELLMLRYYSGMSFKELSAHRNEPIGTTLAKVRRALIKLRGIMSNEE